MPQPINHKRYARMRCCECRTVFFIERELDDNLEETGDPFYCPKGHSQHYGEAPVAKLGQQVYALQTMVQCRDRVINTQRRRIEYLEAHVSPSLWRRFLNIFRSE